VAAILTFSACAVSCGTRGHTAATTATLMAATSTSPPASPTTTGSLSGSTTTAPGTAPPTTETHLVSGAPCRSGQVRIDIPEPVSQSHRAVAPFVVTDTSATPCTLTGYFTVRVVDQIGRVIADTETHEPGPIATITLQPHGADHASFEVHTRTDGGSTDCQDSYFISLALPGPDQNALAGSGAFGVIACDGYVGVTAVVAGSAGHH